MVVENEGNDGSDGSDIEEKEVATDFGFNCTSPEVTCWPNCNMLLCHRRQASAGKKMARATMSGIGSRPLLGGSLIMLVLN